VTLDEAPDVLTVPEVAALLRCGRNQAYQLVRRGDLYAARVGRGLRVPKSALLAYLGVDASAPAAVPSTDDPTHPRDRSRTVVSIPVTRRDIMDAGR
jgi:excisionase family DNA binding protein